MEPLALDLDDQRQELVPEVDATDPSRLVAGVDLATHGREARGPKDLFET